MNEPGPAMPGPTPYQRLAGLGLLFAVVTWAFILHLPALKEGYFAAGDDHVHVAHTNELVRIWREEGRLLGWNRMYGTGFPMFLMRPPGFYFAAGLCHLITGVTVEESLKMVVVLGFCLFPLSLFAGCRLLGLGFWPSVLAGVLAPLPISLWGHTIDAYHYLGVHKQLLAILLFPPTLGSLWCLLRQGRRGLAFALLFPLVLFTHPYIAFCLALLPAFMLIALFTFEPGWDWRRRIPHALMWAVPTFLLCLLWLTPFYASPEIQAIDPFLNLRRSFDVVVSTSAETLRQFFLGGILDTTRWAGTFGGDHEWGWRENDGQLRFPVLTVLTCIGWLVVVLRPRSSAHAFLALGFLVALLLLIGPDDFPFLDRVPFARQFQNIHAIFLFEWAALSLAGLGWYALFRWGASVENTRLRTSCLAVLAALTFGLWLMAARERTMAGGRMIALRSEFTSNGEISLRPNLQRHWVQLKHVVDRLNSASEPGGVAVRSSDAASTVAYNLLPLMVDRPVFTSGFQKVGGVYPLLRGSSINDARTKLRLQELYDVRFVVTSTSDDRPPEQWPETTRLIHANPSWELRQVRGEFGPLQQLPRDLLGFVGSEREWAALMKSWMDFFRKRDVAPPWIVNFTHAGMGAEELAQLEPYLRAVILGAGERAPALFQALETLPYSREPAEHQELMRRWGRPWEPAGTRSASSPLEQRTLETGRARETFQVHNPGPAAPVLFKRAFYRGWQATLDGEDTALFRVSPGFQMILLPPGGHRLSWSYRGPNGWPWGRGAFLLGLVLAVALAGRDRLTASPAPPRPRETAPGSRGALRFVPGLMWCALIVSLGYQTYSEAVLGRPVPIRTPGGRYVIGPTRNAGLDVHWNYVVGIPPEDQVFRVEVAPSPRFEKVLESTQVARNWTRFWRRSFEPGEYYYRVRLEAEDRPYAWTRPKRFEVEN